MTIQVDRDVAAAQIILDRGGIAPGQRNALATVRATGKMCEAIRQTHKSPTQSRARVTA